jgi:hypothetical protein
VSRTIAGFDDGEVDEPATDDAMLAGLRAAKKAGN